MFIFPIFCFFCLTLYFSYTFFRWKYWVNQIAEPTKDEENVLTAVDEKLIVHYQSILKEKSKNFPYSLYSRLFLKTSSNAQEKG